MDSPAARTVDTTEAQRELAAWHPGATIWHGHATGRWWAMRPGVNRLFEAHDPRELHRQLAGFA